jgi:xylulokinase
VAVDIGTSACKVSILSIAGKLIASRAADYPTHYSHGGVAEQNPEDWWGATCRILSALSDEVAKDSVRIEAVALTGQMSALVGVDKNGVPAFPAVIWEDQRAASTVASLADVMEPDEYYRITGNPLSAVYPFVKLMWYQAQKPDAVTRSTKFIQAKDYIAYCLTGALATDYSDASCTGMLDISSRRWSAPLLELAGIDETKFPQLHESTVIIGTLTEQAAKMTGLEQGTPVVLGGGDGPVTAVAANAILPGDFYAAFGTSAWASITRHNPDLDNDRKLLNFCHVLPHLYAVTGSIQNAGNCVQWAVRNILQPPAPAASVSETLLAHSNELLKCPPGSNGLSFLPYLLGDRTPFWSSGLSGTFTGIRAHHNRIEMMHAVLEGIALHFRLVRDIIIPEPDRATPLKVVGGAVAGAIFPQILSDVLHTIVTRTKTSLSSTTVGAAILGGVAIGVWGSARDGLTAFDAQELIESFAPRYDSDIYSPICDRFDFLTRGIERLSSTD